jgi:hypothetical protein
LSRSLLNPVNVGGEGDGEGEESLPPSISAKMAAVRSSSSSSFSFVPLFFDGLVLAFLAVVSGGDLAKTTGGGAAAGAGV